MAKPYSFRYPWGIVTTLEAWRDRFSNNFDSVVNLLSERDRLLEDYLSLDVGQGYLGTGFVQVGSYALTAVYTDVPNMSVTVSVPAGRSLKLTVLLTIANIDGISHDSFVRVLDENNTVVTPSVEYAWRHAAFGGVGATYQYLITAFTSPLPGIHTYRVQARIEGGNGNAVEGGFLSVEDVGPTTR